jgi:putative transposase
MFIETLYGYRQERYLIHGFVMMPDHFHLLITPVASLELAVQCLKGGFSFRSKRAFEWKGDIWVAGFSDHRIRDDEDFEIHRAYIANNPVKAGLVERAEEYIYCSVSGSFELDAFPRGLKPQDSQLASIGASKAAPFQNNHSGRIAETAPFQSNHSGRIAETAPFQSNHSGRIAETAPFQNNRSGRIAETAPFQNDHSGRIAETAPFQNNHSGRIAESAPFQSNRRGRIAETKVLQTESERVTAGPKETP